MNNTIQKKLLVLFILLLSLIPVTVGLFGPLGDILTYHTMINERLMPILTMSELPENMRYFTILGTPFVAHIVLFVMMFFELCVAIIALFGIYLVIFKGSRGLEQGIRYVQLACVWGIIVWGLFFLCVIGVVFMVWYVPSLQQVRSDALQFVLLFSIVIFGLDRISLFLKNGL